ncbi:MAG: WD40 repeat domain-containing protein [Gemmataceae bacterium]
MRATGVLNLAYGHNATRRWLATTDTVAHTVRLWDAYTLKEHPGVLLRHQAVTYGVAFSPTGTLLASMGGTA